MPLPDTRLSRAVVEVVAPLVDGGAFAAKATIDEPVTVCADVFAEGHDLVAAALRCRRRPAAAATPDDADDGSGWSEQPMRAVGNDCHEATFVPDVLGTWEFEVVGWIDRLGTWRHHVEVKIDAGVDVAVDLQVGIALVDATLVRTDTAAQADDMDALRELRRQLADGDTSAVLRAGDVADESHEPDELDGCLWRCGRREPTATSPPYRVEVDPVLARCSAWYEFFPRSTIAPATGHGTLVGAQERLDHIAAMGFDVVYLPPVHPIGVTERKGRNNSVTAAPDDVGSPWGIGAPEGGHRAVHPGLGTVDDVRALADACRARRMELALDIAFNCTPDHPWVTEHPDWFVHRPDGTIQYAENPPKKYQDIYPLDFESDDWAGLWTALGDVFRFWIDAGVTIFRVDNPHTKAFAFWEWVIADVRTDHPEVIFLAEAFTRPRVMERLGKIGFNQSYTYFTWRQSSWELREYFEDLSTRTVDYFRPNAWPNTPDILTEQLQTGGRSMFVIRAILAATLSPSWGVYGPAFELLEHLPMRPGSEEYLDSEKYQLRQWHPDHPESLAPLLASLNAARRANAALGHLRTLQFHNTDSPAGLCYSKTDPAGQGDPILVVVNIDAHERHRVTVDIDVATIGLEYGASYELIDQLGDTRLEWQGSHNTIELDPLVNPAHVFRVKATTR
ncbi:MAG: alpha-1,4-glucan--maltose-1-phosphate maltosyltransferase [Acidimicrobiia bacterium]|nr:alpha-1,4-glucan--maltose-1-phosphate maltosyltransferase [Acidimicrobiia bacterium]